MGPCRRPIGRQVSARPCVEQGTHSNIGLRTRSLGQLGVVPLLSLTTGHWSGRSFMHGRLIRAILWLLPLLPLLLRRPPRFGRSTSTGRRKTGPGTLAELDSQVVGTSSLPMTITTAPSGIGSGCPYCRTQTLPYTPTWQPQSLQTIGLPVTSKPLLMQTIGSQFDVRSSDTSNLPPGMTAS